MSSKIQRSCLLRSKLSREVCCARRACPPCSWLKWWLVHAECRTQALGMVSHHGALPTGAVRGGAVGGGGGAGVVGW